MKRRIVVALAGNPNSGKTTIFNELTGARQHVGNYPGVTVERKEGWCRHGDVELQVVDLPGTYSLTAYSAEELVARNFIIEEKPDVVVDVIDASNLERNLYLAVQLMELGVPLVLAFNMSDMARARGYELNIEKFSRFFRARIVETVGHKGVGMSELINAVIEAAEEGATAHSERERSVGQMQLSSRASIRGLSAAAAVRYGREIKEEMERIEALLKENGVGNGRYDTRWLALKLLENDGQLRAAVAAPVINEQIDASIARIEKLRVESVETAIAAARYGFIAGACQEAVRSTLEIRRTISDG